ncbi:transglycosylase domain-containing protein [Rubritalea spongiae]|uniref:peptidoglycan glycosyltransferase n=1 Tax=Rubritalea spongiae TaxID=430797 RepID=A0ABW5E4Y7_9BACT
MAAKKKKSAKRKTTKKRAAKKTQNRKRRSQRSTFFRLLFWPVTIVDLATQKWHPFWNWCARSVATCFTIGFALFVAAASFYWLRASTYDLDKITEMPARSIVYANDGETEIGTVHGDNRLMLKFNQIAPSFKQALIAREDARFYKHGAIDPRGLVRAFSRFITRGKKEGASTITMQLADNSFSYDGKSIDGKLLEMALAVRIENRYSKDEILENYMNRIFWGHSIRGIEAASRTYFEKPASQLTLSESALLAGIIRGPNTFSPFVDFEAALNQRDVTLSRMVHYDFITQAQAEEAKKEELHIRPNGRRIIHDSYAMDAIRRDLEVILEKHNIEMGGLHVITTIDPALQKAAEESVEKRLKAVESRSGFNHQTRNQFLQIPAKKRKAPNYIQGAVVCIENKSGAIRAIVGGRNADESKFNRALYGRRQIGSIFKPFVYMTAFDKGMQPGAWVRDSRIRPGEIKGAYGNWSPANSDRTYENMMTVREALARSRNTASVRIGDYAKIENVLETARKVGFEQEIPKTPATYLGAFEATPQQVAQAYSAFPNGGVIYRPFIIAQITDADGNVVYPGSGAMPYQAAKTGSAWLVSDTLEEVTKRGTAASLRSSHGFDAPCGGKTGTTDNYRDAWFAGYTSSLTCAVWVGMDDNKPTVHRGYGSTLALPIWADVMKSANRSQYPTHSLEPNFPFKKMRLCRYTSQVATNGCEQQRTAYTAEVPSDLIPKHTCDNHPVRAQVIDEAAPPRAVPAR